MPFRVSITIIITTFWWCAAMAKIYQRCELARELKKLAVPPQEIPTWVCIAQHESLFDTSAMNLGSGDHGLFQISEIYWCSPSGYGCHKPCTAFRDDDIADDIECVRRIHNEHTQISGDGWNAWVVYPLYCKGDVVHYIQNCDLESVNVTLNEIPNEGSTEKFVDEFGDGYQFPPLPSYNGKSQNTHSNDISVLKGDYGDGYQFPPLPTIKNDNFKSTFNNFKEDFEKYKDEYEFPQSEIELPQRVDNFGDGYQFPPFPTFDNLPEVLDNRVKIKPLEKTTENVGYVSFQKIIENRLKNSQPEETKTKTVESSTKLIKVQKFSSKTTRQVEATTTTILDNRFSHLGETTTKKDAVSSTQAPFTFKMFSLTPFILNGEAVSINGEKVTTKPKLTKLDTSDISLSESIKSYTATSKNSKPHVQSSTTLKTTTPELISIKTSTNAPVALALQSLSQTKSETSTKRVRTLKPKTKSTKLYSSKYRTTKAPSTTEKSFIINTISAFVPKSDKKTSATTSSIKAITFKPLTTTTVSTLTKIIDIPSTEQPSSTLKLPISTFKPLSVFSSNIFSLNSSAIHKPIYFPSSNAINGSLDLFANATSKPFSFSTYAPFADSLNSSLRQVTFPSYFPSWFQTLPPALPPLPPLPNMRPSSGKPSRPFATRPTRRTTTSRPIRPLRPLFSQVTYKPSESSTETQFKLINSESPIPKINSFNAGNTIESSYFKNENSSPLPLSKFEKLSKFPSFEGNTGEVHTQPITRDYFSDIFDIESKISPDEELEEIILEPDYSFYRTKHGYRLFRRSPKRES